MSSRRCAVKAANVATSIGLILNISGQILLTDGLLGRYVDPVGMQRPVR
jgi:hypothetical protein